MLVMHSEKKMKCCMCAKPLGPVDVILGKCEGCDTHACTKHKLQHASTCSAFITKRTEQERQALKRRLEKEATKAAKVDHI
jgi:predicted nucleic acid binding AN1-type Zn finger protein